MKRLALFSTVLLIAGFGYRYWMNIQPLEESPPQNVQTNKKENVTKKNVIAIATPDQGQKDSDSKLVKLDPKKPITMTQNLNDPEAFIPMTEKGELYVGHATVYPNEEVVVAHGDLIISDTKDLKKHTEGGEPFLIPPPKKWPKGVIPYVISTELKGSEQEMAIFQAMKEFTTKTVIQFKPRMPENDDYVLFSKGSENCLSNYGRIGGEQKIFLSEGCDKGKIIHELMHTLGFLHEQNREDRDQYLRVLWQNIDENFHLQFKKIKIENRQIFQTGFDFTSIMLYPPEAFSITQGDYAMVNSEGSPYPVNRHSLSTKDLLRIKILYAPSNE